MTGLNADATAFSYNGGRWAPSEMQDGGFAVLYTSLTDQGALAEVASYLLILTPVPRKPLMLHRLSVTSAKTLRLVVGDFRKFGIDPEHYVRRNYDQTQKFGAALSYLGFDGLIAPSARWHCDDLMIFQQHHALEERLEPIGSRQVSHAEWSALAESIEAAEQRFLGGAAIR